MRLDGLGNGFGHPCLPRPGLKTGQIVAQGAGIAKKLGQIGHGAMVTRIYGETQHG